MVPCSSHLDFLSAFQTYQTCSRPSTFAVVDSSARNVLAQISMWLTLINGVNPWVTSLEWPFWIMIFKVGPPHA